MYPNLRGKGGVCRIVFGNNQQPAGVLVNPVYDSRANHPTDTGQMPAAMPEQCVDQRPVRISGRGMHHHPRRLIDDNDVIILINDIQRNFLRLCVCRNRLGFIDLDHIPGAQPVIFRRTRTVDRNLPVFNQLCRRGAGQCAFRRRECVQPFPCLLRQDGQRDGQLFFIGHVLFRHRHPLRFLRSLRALRSLRKFRIPRFL
ncbi:unknown [Clostridium sp. CAG:448]|nr:unknown [Clostridium sp. CAG:448]